MTTWTFINGVPFPAEDHSSTPSPGGPVNVDGGARELPPQPPRIVWTRDPDDRAWWSATFVDRP